MLQTLSTRAAPSPLGHYSQAICDRGTLYVSGQLPIDASGHVQLGSIEEQTRLTLGNLEAILRAAGGTRQDVVKVVLYFSDIAHWAAINAVYAEFFGAHRPARSAVPTGRLHFGAEVEIEAVARIPAGPAPVSANSCDSA